MTVRSMEPKIHQGRRRILVIGYFGAHNVGDEAILEAMIANLHEHFEISVAGLYKQSPYENVRYTHLPSLTSPMKIIEFIRELRSVDALILGGGGYLANELQHWSILYWLSLIATAKILRKKAVVFGAGCGPFKKGLMRSILIKPILDQLDAIIVRDSASKRFLEESNVVAPTHISSDLAFLLEPLKGVERPRAPSDSLARQPIVIFVLPKRFHIEGIWKQDRYRAKYEGYVRAVSEMADAVVEKLQGAPVFLPFAPEDLEMYREIVAIMKHKEKAVIQDGVDFENLEFRNLVQTLGNASIVIGGRYHSVIFSALAGTPVIPVIYHPKISDLARRLHLDDVSLEIGDGIEWKDVDIDAKGAIDTLVKAYSCKNDLRSSILKHRELVRREALDSIQLLRSLI